MSIARLCYVVCDQPGCQARAASENQRIGPSKYGNPDNARFVAELYSGFAIDETGDWCEEHNPNRDNNRKVHITKRDEMC